MRNSENIIHLLREGPVPKCFPNNYMSTVLFCFFFPADKLIFYLSAELIRIRSYIEVFDSCMAMMCRENSTWDGHKGIHVSCSVRRVWKLRKHVGINNENVSRGDEWGNLITKITKMKYNNKKKNSRRRKHTHTRARAHKEDVRRLRAVARSLSAGRIYCKVSDIPWLLLSVNTSMVYKLRPLVKS